MATDIVDRAIDIGIITIVPSEIDALFGSLGISRDAFEPAASPLQYWRTSYRSHSSGRSVSIVVSILGAEAGNTESAIAVTNFLRDWYPRLMCLVGIAAGVKDETRIADVLFPNKVHDQTIKVFENESYRVRGRTYARNDIVDRMLKVQPLSTTGFLTALDQTARADIQRAEQAAELKGLGPSEFDGRPRLMDGSIVSDNVLIRDGKYFDPVLDNTDEKCRGGEMEAAGFVLACQRERPDFPWLVVRAISDFGDSTKDDSFQLLAAKSACTALRLFIEQTLTIEVLPQNPRALRSRSTLEFNLVRQIREAFANERWQEVCRIGAVLSRPLWLSGHTALRYEIGLLVDNAAAYSNNSVLRARVLIDDLGWTAFKLGDSQKGEKHIKDGIRLATECKDYYVISKGFRHLASSQREKGDLEAVESLLAKSQEAAALIGDEGERREMLSTLQVSRAKLLYAHGAYAGAVDLFRAVLKDFINTNDVEREVKVYAQLALCSQKLGDLTGAEALYLTGRDKARELGRFDEFAQNTRGAITLLGNRDPSRSKAFAKEVYEFALSNGLWDDARKWHEEHRLAEVSNPTI